MFVSKLHEETTRVLEWPRLLEALASHARSSLGAETCRSLPVETELQRARQRQQETTEMVALRATTDPFPPLSFPDVREPLDRAAKGGSLEATELRDCSIVLSLAEEVSRYLGRHRQEASGLNETAHEFGELAGSRRLRQSLDAAIDRDGCVKESATEDLRRLTHRAQDLKQHMRHRLEQILQSKRYAEVLQEFYFAQREGRYVVPIKAEMQGRIPGIVHDVSASGATVFLEPRELVELNNAIKVADLEVEREVRRILRELSAQVAAHADSITTALTVLARLDGIMAKAEFSQRILAHPVRLNDEGRVMLKQARHPLLVLTKERVVPNDILMNETVQVLVISGPNTGGKTVTLKIVGLFALMAQAGMHLPCDPESEMAVFAAVYADIGDAQDLAKDLSSFSAHMVQMVQLLAETHTRRASEPAAAASKQTLVLLDEPVTSTDPEEGAALAAALLCRLASLNMKVVATTHYNALKALAQATGGFANASVEFDVAKLVPTYRLFMGTPGGSSAIEIAGRLGMDEALLSEARRRLRKEDQTLEHLVRDLQARQRQLTDDTERAAQERMDAEKASHKAKELLARLEETEQEERKGIKRKLSEQFSRARAEVQATIDRLKRDQKLIKAKEAKTRLTELETQVRSEVGRGGATIPTEQLAVGDQVEIGGLGMTGRLLEPPQGKKRVRVKVGEGEILATVANLVGVDKGAPQTAEVSKVPSSRPRLSPTGADGLGEDSVVDVRGKMSEDALDQVVAALDRTALAGAPFLRIIHGHGTGKLKTVLREYLKESPYVAGSRPGDRAEGGDGVTIVQLR